MGGGPDPSAPRRSGYPRRHGPLPPAGLPRKADRPSGRRGAPGVGHPTEFAKLPPLANRRRTEALTIAVPARALRTCSWRFLVSFSFVIAQRTPRPASLRARRAGSCPRSRRSGRAPRMRLPGRIERAVSQCRCEDKYRVAPTAQRASRTMCYGSRLRALVRQRSAVSRNASVERLPFAVQLAHECRHCDIRRIASKRNQQDRETCRPGISWQGLPGIASERDERSL
jgi:hypothetical protein